MFHVERSVMSSQPTAPLPSLTSELTKGAITSIRAALGAAGIVSLVVGLLILIWPGKTAMVVTAIIAIYAILAGLVYGSIGLFARSSGGWARIGHIVLAVIFVVAGVVSLGSLGQTTAYLATFLGILVGILWIIEGFVSLTNLGGAASKIWTVIFAIISIVAGIVLLTTPLWGALVIWTVIGISLLILGVVQIVRAFTFGKELLSA